MRHNIGHSNIYTSGVLQWFFHAAVVSHFMFISPLTCCAHLSNYLGCLNTKSFVSPRDLTGQSLIDFQGLALSKNAISLWFFMFHLFLCVMSDQTWVQSLKPKAFKAVTRQAVKNAILCAPLSKQAYGRRNLKILSNLNALLKLYGEPKVLIFKNGKIAFIIL